MIDSVRQQKIVVKNYLLLIIIVVLLTMITLALNEHFLLGMKALTSRKYHY